MSRSEGTARETRAACDGDGSDVVRVTCSECALDREVPDVESALDLQDHRAAAAGIRHVLEFECARADD